MHFHYVQSLMVQIDSHCSMPLYYVIHYVPSCETIGMQNDREPCITLEMAHPCSSLFSSQHKAALHSLPRFLTCILIIIVDAENYTNTMT